jgi:hypothetical protein
MDPSVALHSDNNSSKVNKHHFDLNFEAFIGLLAGVVIVMAYVSRKTKK